LHGGGDLQAIADDACVVQQALDLAAVVARDLCRIKAVECAAIILALFEDGVPA